MLVLPSGVLLSSLVSGLAQVEIYRGGVSSDTTFTSFGYEFVYSGGVASAAVLSSGGDQGIGLSGTAIGTVVSSGGYEAVSAGGVASGAVVSDGGYQVVNYGGVASGTVLSSGGIEVLYSGGVASSMIVLLGGSIDLPNLTYVSGGSASVDSSTDILTVTEGSSIYTQQLAGKYDGLSFSVGARSLYGGSQITADSTPCFCRGTLIRTERGEAPVETLNPGDRVVTLSGAVVPVRWLGWRRVELLGHPEPARVRPIRIQAGAFGPGQPARDLLLSPEHAVFVDGVLIPARYLVGCAGITVDTTLAATTYYHVELPLHDVLLAEGLPCESWLDTGNRSMFANAAVAQAWFDECPGADAATTADTAWATKACAPLVTGGAALVAARRRLGADGVQTLVIDREGLHQIMVAPGIETVRLVAAPGRAPGDDRTLGAGDPRTESGRCSHRIVGLAAGQRLLPRRDVLVLDRRRSPFDRGG